MSQINFIYRKLWKRKAIYIKQSLSPKFDDVTKQIV